MVTFLVLSLATLLCHAESIEKLVDHDIPEYETTLTDEDFQVNSTTAERIANISKTNSKHPEERRSDLFEGDILLVSDMRLKRSAIRLDHQHWPNAEIPYTVSSRYTDLSRKLIGQAMRRFHDETCVRFVPRRGHSDYVYIHPDDGCYSVVGMVKDKQPLSLDETCLTVGTAMHELMHVAGFFHEQNRPDRDDYVTVVWRNVIEEAKDQFKKYEDWLVMTEVGKYDYGSIMHYSPWAFSKFPRERKTIKPKKTKDSDKMGQREKFSTEDIRKLNMLYECEEQTAKTINRRIKARVRDAKPDDGADSGGTSRTLTRTSGVSNVKTVPCKNTHKFCRKWKRDNYCMRFARYMKEHCPKVCGLC